MDTSSLINRQFKIHYARSREIELAAGNGCASTTKPKISTKEWVFRTFYPGAKAGKSSASVHAVTDGGTVVAAIDKITETLPLPKDDWNRSHEPAVSFRQVVIDSAAEKFKFSLVGKFYRSRPCLEVIRKWVSAKLRLVGEWSVTLLDRNHVLIKLDNEDDMLRIWPRSRWFVRGHLMKVFKWTPDFRPSDGEPSTAPVWISFPSLPVVYFEQDLLYAIASLLGRVLSMDVPTRRLSRTNVARVCVEVDLLKEHPHQVWIGVENGGFWQAVKYERLPSYCTNCRQQGHSAGICKRKRNTGTSRILEMEETKSMNQKPHIRIKEEKHDVHRLNVEKHYQTCPSLLEKDRRGNLVINSSSHRTLNSLTCKQHVKEGTVEGKGGCNEEEPGFSASGSRKKDNNSILTIGSFSKENVSGIEEKLWRSVEMPHKGKSLIQEEIKEVEEEEEFDDDQEQQEAEEEEVQEAGKLANSKEEKGGKQEIVPSNLAADYHEEQKQIERGANNGLPKQSPHGSGKKKTLFFWKKRPEQREDVNDLAEFPYINVRRFALRELRVATNGFSARNILGRGAFGKVFKGRLADGLLVAVKRLEEEKNPVGELQFQTEVQILGIALHKNLLPLLGFCMTSTERILVYPYMANGSVAYQLRDGVVAIERGPNELRLNWTIRKSIAVGTAQGLSYLHEQINPKIIHRDVKAANILLNEEFEPLIGDFGLAKAMPFKGGFSVTTAVRGTMGHIAPEYVSTGKASQKTDVFGYGITLLELVTGQRAIDFTRVANHDQEVLLQNRVKGLLKMNCLDRIVDPNLYGVYNVAELSQLVSIALLCTKGSPEERPIMSEVVRMLEEKVLGGIEPQPVNNQNLEPAVDLFTNHADVSSHTQRRILDKETVEDGEKSVTTVVSISSEISLPR